MIAVSTMGQLIVLWVCATSLYIASREAAITSPAVVACMTTKCRGLPCSERIIWASSATLVRGVRRLHVSCVPLVSELGVICRSLKHVQLLRAICVTRQLLTCFVCIVVHCINAACSLFLIETCERVNFKRICEKVKCSMRWG